MTKKLAATVCYALFSLTPDPVLACRYHGLGNGISQQTPGSIDVAIALQQGVVDGLLNSELVSPNFKKDIFGTGYRRAVRRLEQLRFAIERARGDHADRTPFSLILVEASLWSRYEPSASGEMLKVHQAGASPGDTVVVTGEAVVEAIATGKLSADDAFKRKLIVISTGAGTHQAVEPLLRRTLASLPSPVAER
ncbi:hypothetical protein SAMN04488498_1573 [Mesorhizobium albiziae]|uniref:Uncharacterized protein n=1 Tax=Neomesorhizobium albiziae TaxID=335020 RepID=A0A1I4FSJ5_9HYPH|nr:hypothetical protein [Mesorhizobium albiziae]GLS31168.1 hypothetical protein GCM10007937_28770 [Mesorhizobium albiziae]SFL20563.1 hypothetical protein SAMN04488498_1573 [Mesorhizobium albiziae]